MKQFEKNKKLYSFNEIELRKMLEIKDKETIDFVCS